MAQGYLQVDVVSDANSFPVQDADIVIARTEEPDEIIEETRTNSSGQTENLPLDAPPLELSLSPEETERPYAEFKTSKVFQKIFLRISNASITASCNISDVNIVIVPADGSSAE